MKLPVLGTLIRRLRGIWGSGEKASATSLQRQLRTTEELQAEIEWHTRDRLIVKKLLAELVENELRIRRYYEELANQR